MERSWKLTKSKAEMELMRKSCRLVAETLELLGGRVKAGVTTAELDRIAEEHIRSKGGLPSFKGYRGYPASICTSVNSEVVHGIPGKAISSRSTRAP
jgi:methionyl aminopeptidase